MSNEMENYDEANIAAIREEWAKEDSIESTTYTMVQSNTLCKVDVTAEGMLACAEALIDL